MRWSAVFAGTLVALSLWGVLQLLGIGAGLAALDPDNVRSARGAAIGAGAWSVIAPLIALFVGGWVAGKLASTYERKVAGGHGLVVWGLTVALGLVASIFMVRGLAMRAERYEDRHHEGMMGYGMGYGMGHGMENGAAVREARDALVPINARLAEAKKPMISPHQLLEAVRAAKTEGGFDHGKFIQALDANTALDTADAEAVANQLGPSPASLADRATMPGPEARDALAATRATGTALLGLSIAMLVGLLAAIGGALLSVRRASGREDKATVPSATPTSEAASPTDLPPTAPGG